MVATAGRAGRVFVRVDAHQGQSREAWESGTMRWRACLLGAVRTTRRECMHLICAAAGTCARTAKSRLHVHCGSNGERLGAGHIRGMLPLQFEALKLTLDLL